MTSAISARGLAKEFGNVKAVRKVDLEVAPGEIYGFLGRNGAGKTTTIRMLLGLIKPGSGEIALFGESVRERRLAALRKAGYLVESSSAYPNLTVRENLELQRLLTGAHKGSVGKSLALLRLEEYADRKSGHLSLGNKQRLSLARALIHSPRLLILDEPANGLDPSGIVEIRNLLRSLADEGITIFMSSHILGEVDQLADRIGIIHDGVLVEELGRKELGTRKRLYIELAVDRADRAETLLREKLGIRGISRLDGGVIRIADEKAECGEIAREIVTAGIGLERLLPVEENLEEHFMRITGGQT